MDVTVTNSASAQGWTLAGPLLLALMTAAVVQDLCQQRISNSLNFCMLGLGLLLMSLAAGWQGLQASLFGAATGLALLLPFYLQRGMGAADVKLMAAAGAWLGPQGALVATALSLLTGGVLALGLVLRRRRALRANPTAQPPGAGGQSAVAGPDSARERVPADAATAAAAAGASAPGMPGALGRERFAYAPAIAFGTLLTLWWGGSAVGQAALSYG